MFIERLVHALDEAKVPYAIVGGYAVALHGAVRGTIDVDLAIQSSKKDFISIEKVFGSLGLESRLPVRAEQIYDFRKEYIQNRNLIAWSFYNPKKPIEVVDVLLTEDLAKMKVVRIQSGGITYRVASLTDLIRMKSTAGRPQDLIDIEALQRLKKGKPVPRRLKK